MSFIRSLATTTMIFMMRLSLTLPKETTISTPRPPTTTTTTTAAELPEVCVSAEGTFAEAARLAALESAFGQNSQCDIDLIFVIDRSNSIGEIEFNETKQLILEILTFITLQSHIRIDGIHTRIAIISFGIRATPEFDGISAEGGVPLDACAFAERLNDLKLRNADANQSRVPVALWRAGRLFDSSRNLDNKRTDIRQILWIFFDGAEGIPLFYDGRTSEDWARELRSDGVTIFSVGVGAWLRISIERENRVAELATSEDHYACLETWAKILRERTKPIINQDSQSKYSTITPVSGSRCTDCPSDFECVCDVTTRRYKCTAQRSREGHQTWIVPGVVVPCSALGIVILASVATWIVGRRHKATRLLKSQSFYEDPPLPPPLSCHQQEEDNLYGSLEVDTVSLTCSLSSVTSSQAGSVTHGIAVQYHISYPQTAINQRLEKPLTTLERPPPTWHQYLSEEKAAKHLRHLALTSVGSKRWVTTPKFGITEKDLIRLQRLMDHGDLRKVSKLKLAGRMYVIDTELAGDEHVHARRRSKSGDEEIVWIAKISDYVIVGVAGQVSDDACRRVVREIYQHLELLIQMSGLTSKPEGNSGRH